MNDASRWDGDKVIQARMQARAPGIETLPGVNVRERYIPDVPPDLYAAMVQAYHSARPVFDRQERCSKGTGLEAVYRLLRDHFEADHD